MGLAWVAVVHVCGAQETAQFPEARNPQIVALGQRLFFEKRLSETGETACASCHFPERSFTDGRKTSIGQHGTSLNRNAPTLLNRPMFGFQTWDGRVTSLRDQSASPLENPEEMGQSVDDACRRLNGIERYRRLFADVFGYEEIDAQGLTTAIAAYVASLRASESDFERGQKLGSLAPAVARGEQVFHAKAKCGVCHSGSDFTDERFHNTGVAWKSDHDLGRGAITGRNEDLRTFKTPTLRELTRTGPYMHNGHIKTLSDVVQHYVSGGATRDPNLDPAIKPLELDDHDIEDLVAFLRSLSDSRGPAFYTPEQ